MPSPSKKTIVLVDDDPDHLTICKLILHKAGYKVFVFESGVSLTALAEEISFIRPNLIYVDHEMPAFTGGQLIQYLRYLQIDIRVPILYFSGRLDIEQLALKYGADGYLTKPFDADKLIAVTEEFVRDDGGVSTSQEAIA